MTDLVQRLRKRAEIRRSIPRGEPDRISDILEEAANRIEELERRLAYKEADIKVRVTDPLKERVRKAESDLASLLHGIKGE